MNTGHSKLTDLSEAPKLRDDITLGTMQCVSVMFSYWATDEFSSKQIAQEHSKPVHSSAISPRDSGPESLEEAQEGAF